MVFDPAVHHRRSIRLKGYDYSQPGAYFVTVCTFKKQCILGEIIDGMVRLNWVGDVAVERWLKLRDKFPGIEVEPYVVMPNHIHGIITITAAMGDVGAHPRVRPRGHCTIPQERGHAVAQEQEGGRAGPPLPRIVQWFKTMTTNEYIRRIKERDAAKVAGKLWQRGYYEHIIRNDKSWGAIRRYIESNPARWQRDPDNPRRLIR